TAMSTADRTDLPPERAEAFAGPTVREKVVVEEHTFLIERPDEIHAIPNHHSLRAAFAEGEYVPYWTDLWPASRMLAKAVLREPWPPGIEVLEVGCGLGLPGVAALARGLRVIFSDYDLAALEFAARNARLNKLEQFRVLRLDWHAPPEDLRVPVVLAS